MKTSFLKTSLLALALLLSAAVSHAAPIPATSTSKLVSPQLGLYRSPLGFQITAGGSGWVHSAAPKGNKFIATVYKAPTAAEPGSVASRITADLNSKNAIAGATTAKNSTAASLTVRVDDLQKEVPLDKYIQKWMKEYPRYGFDVLGSKPFVQNKQRGYVLDLLNREQGKQLRQVVFVKQKRAVILTCRDQVATFQTSLKGCNQIIRSFEW